MFVLVDDQCAHAFDQVTMLEPLLVQMQFHLEAVFQAQVTASAQHLQGHGHGQGRTGFQQLGGFQRPFVAVGHGHCP
ncbi:hypothetical protein D3C80_2109730 [compost metagenome]